MTEIDVRYCTVRVVRRDGWSWGSDPRRLLDGVLAAVPGLVADALAGSVPDGPQVIGTLRIAAPVHRHELAALARVGREPGAAVPAGLHDALTRALAGALAERGIGRGSPAGNGDGPGQAAPARPMRPGPATLRLLVAWHERGVLAGMLDLLSPPVLAAWHRTLVTGWRTEAGAADPGELEAALDDAAAAAPAGWRAAQPGDPATRLRRHLLALVAIAVRTGLAPCRPEVLAAVDGRLGPAAAPEPPPDPAPAVGLPESRTLAVPGAPLPAPRAPAVPAAVRIASRRPGQVDVRVGSALPFLLLAPLGWTGWLDTLGVAVEAAGLADHWPALAAALALKVLGPAERGWYRAPADLVTAAAFAGSDEPVGGAALHAPARHAGLLAPALDAAVGQALVDGHTSGAPLVLAEAASGAGLVLLDGEGLFPVAWADDAAGLLPWLQRFPGERVAVRVGGSLPEVLDVVSEAGASADDPDEARDQELLDRAGAVLDGLGSRPAVPLATDPALERSLTLAAGLGLAAIAWTLWGHREPTDPMLAIERLGSLDAAVRRTDRLVRVRVPLGARHSDLSRHRLLGTVRGVPWLGDRPVQIEGG